jgi:hypothetical protein
MCSRKQLRRREAGWRAAGGEPAARRMTHPFRRRAATSPLIRGEVWRRGRSATRGESLSAISTGRCVAGSATSSLPIQDPRARQDDPPAPAGDVAKANATVRLRQSALRPSAMAQCRLRECRAVRPSHGLANGETASMKKPLTAEPYAGKPPLRFAGRGRRKPIPTLSKRDACYLQRASPNFSTASTIRSTSRYSVRWLTIAARIAR